MNPYVIAAAVGYLLGSIPFGYLLVRIFKGEDVRATGSGNIGATNVGRKSPALGVATLVLDAAKGLAAVLAARALFGGPHQQLIMTTAAFFAVLGHLFPVWLKFRGARASPPALELLSCSLLNPFCACWFCFFSLPSPSATSRSGPSLWRRLFRCWRGHFTNTRTQLNWFLLPWFPRSSSGSTAKISAVSPPERNRSSGVSQRQSQKKSQERS